MDKLQINVRLSQDQIDSIDRKRIELQQAMGKIPNRSDVLRYALDQYLTGVGSPMAPSAAKRSKASK
jgi:Arc/MetJ-type ribon-helix-helix transcriptional regulator